jgi:hypothetical protein
MRSEDGGAWFVPANGGEETAILIKAPTATLKSVLSGSSITIVIGLESGYLCTGVRLFDVPGAALLLCSVQRHQEEHAALKKVAREGRSPLFLFNEMDICVAWSEATLLPKDKVALLDFLESGRRPYCGPLSPEASSVLDSFCFTIDKSQQFPHAKKIPVIEIPVVAGAWVSNKISFAGVHDHHTITLDDLDEGAVLEKAVWASLESVFPLTLQKSPQVKVGDKLRELTDVLAFHQYGTFLIEAKDLSVLRAGTERTRERRVKGTQKQAKTAVEQLIGASKALKRGEKITDQRGKTLTPVLGQPLHCIVLVTELMHEGDWSELEARLLQAMIETGDFFHVLDLRELVILLKASSGKPELLDYNLMQRCERFVDTGTIHIRSRPAPKPGRAESI